MKTFFKILQHLLNDGFITRYRDACLITGRGQPDHATRSFLVQLSHLYNDTPIYILTDCDIYGVLIACTYRSTFKEHQHHRLRWLGVWPEELLSLPSFHISQTLPITDERERRMITRFIQRADINDEWRRQVSFFEQHQRKMEIEAIYENGTKSLINDYLHDKLMGHRWL
jgi:DNA topoisomerase VI subunit A